MLREPATEIHLATPSGEASNGLGARRPDPADPGGPGHRGESAHRPSQDLQARPGWHADALCAQSDPEAFFPEKGMSARAAKQICAACPVAAQCLDWAIEHNERHGVWGGLTEHERVGLRRSRRRAAAPILPDDRYPTAQRRPDDTGLGRHTSRPIESNRDGYVA